MATEAMHDQLVKQYVGGSPAGYLSDAPAQVHVLALDVERTPGKLSLVRELTWRCECGWTRTDVKPPGVEVVQGRLRWGGWNGDPTS